MKKTRNFAEVLRKKLEANPALKSAVEQEAFNTNVARQILEARTKAGLTQTALAKKVGTHQSVIARMEDADYDGHSLKMLKKIADALDCTMSVELYPRTMLASADVVTTTTITTTVTVETQQIAQIQFPGMVSVTGVSAS